MLVSEVTVLTASLLALRWDMTTDGGTGGYQDMRIYSVMCSMSTFCAFLLTVTIMVVPEHVCTCSPLH